MSHVRADCPPRLLCPKLPECAAQGGLQATKEQLQRLLCQQDGKSAATHEAALSGPASIAVLQQLLQLAVGDPCCSITEQQYSPSSSSSSATTTVPAGPKGSVFTPQQQQEQQQQWRAAAREAVQLFTFQELGECAALSIFSCQGCQNALTRQQRRGLWPEVVLQMLLLLLPQSNCPRTACSRLWRSTPTCSRLFWRQQLQLFCSQPCCNNTLSVLPRPDLEVHSRRLALMAPTAAAAVATQVAMAAVQEEACATCRACCPWLALGCSTCPAYWPRTHCCCSRWA